MAATFRPNTRFGIDWGRTIEAKLLLEAVAEEGVSECKAQAGGHQRYEDSFRGGVRETPLGPEAYVEIAGPWGFITRFAEFGTRHQAATPMLRPGTEAAVHKFGGQFVPAQHDPRAHS